MMWVHTFSTEMQNDSMMCGVACLSMICQQYGKDYSQEYLTSPLCPDHRGCLFMVDHGVILVIIYCKESWGRFSMIHFLVKYFVL